MKNLTSQNSTIDDSITACDKYTGIIVGCDSDPDLPGITKGYLITVEYHKNNKIQLTEFNMSDLEVDKYIHKGLIFKPENLVGKLVEVHIKNEDHADFEYEVFKADIKFYNNPITFSIKDKN